MLDFLPIDVLLLVQAHLLPIDLRHLCETSKHFSNLFKDKRIWIVSYHNVIYPTKSVEKELDNVRDVSENFLSEEMEASSSEEDSDEDEYIRDPPHRMTFHFSSFREFPRRSFPSDVKRQLEKALMSNEDLPECFTDRNMFFQTFFGTFRTFWISSFSVLLTLIRIYGASENRIKLSSETKDESTPLKLLILRLINRWVESHFIDFDPPVLSLLNVFLNGRVYRDHRDCCAIGKGISGILRYKIEFVPHPPTPIHKQMDDIFWCPRELANQLTLIDFDHFRSIEPFEFIFGAKEAAFGHCHLDIMMRRFQVVSSWVATLILSETSLKLRAERLSFFIQVADYLLEIQNFHTMFSIVKGLEHKAVKMLKHSKDELSKSVRKSFKTLKLVTKLSSHNYDVYRKALIESDFPEYPVLPLCGLFLVDCTNVEMSLEDTLSRKDPSPNWVKRLKLHSILSEFKRYKEHPFRFAEIPELRIQLETKNLKYLDDRQLTNRVALLEPRRSKKGKIFNYKGKK